MENIVFKYWEKYYCKKRDCQFKNEMINHILFKNIYFTLHTPLIKKKKNI